MTQQEINNKLYNLSHKPMDYKFTDDEIKFILMNSDIQNAKAKYFIWKQERHNKKYIGFMLDFMPFRVRKTGVDNSTDIICTRDLCKLEKLEEAQNYGCRNRIMHNWNYKDVEALIEDDLKYGIQTPQKFIDHCKRLGHTNPNYKSNEQLKLFA